MEGEGWAVVVAVEDQEHPAEGCRGGGAECAAEESGGGPTGGTAAQTGHDFSEGGHQQESDGEMNDDDVRAAEEGKPVVHGSGEGGEW